MKYHQIVTTVDWQTLSRRFVLLVLDPIWRHILNDPPRTIALLCFFGRSSNLFSQIDSKFQTFVKFSGKE